MSPPAALRRNAGPTPCPAIRTARSSRPTATPWSSSKPTSSASCACRSRPTARRARRRVIAELPDTDPDGVALDADGRYWVTLYRPDGLVRIDAGGRRRARGRRPPRVDVRRADEHRVGRRTARSRGGRERRRHVPVDRRRRGRRAAAASSRPVRCVSASSHAATCVDRVLIGGYGPRELASRRGGNRMHRSRVVDRGVVVVGVALVAAACGSDSGEEGGAGGDPAPSRRCRSRTRSLVFGNFGAYTPKGFLEDFTAETGVEVTLSEFSTNEDMLGKLQAADGTGYDVVMVTGNYLQTLVDSGWVAELDHAQIPNLANLYPEATQLAFDPGNVYSVPYTWGTTGLCYRTDLVNTEIDSWNDLLNPAPELAGQGHDARHRAVAAAAGAAEPRVLDQHRGPGRDRGGEAAHDRREGAHRCSSTTPTSTPGSTTASAGMVHAWDGWCNYAENKNVEFVVPSEGSDLFADTLVVMESSQNKEAAHAFIDFVLAAENHVQGRGARALQGAERPRDGAARSRRWSRPTRTSASSPVGARRLRGGPSARRRGPGRLESGGGGDQGRLGRPGGVVSDAQHAIRRNHRSRAGGSSAAIFVGPGVRLLARCCSWCPSA